MSLEKLEAADAARDLQLIEARLRRDCGDDFAAAVAAAWIMGSRVAVNRLKNRRTCRICGCWELGACEGGCAWAEADLCTACVEP